MLEPIADVVITSEERLHVYLIGSPDVAVPPRNYGGVEYILGLLVALLAQLGHKVTLFAGHGSSVEGVRCVSLLREKSVVGGRAIFTREVAHAELARQFILGEMREHPRWQRKTVVHFHTDAVLPVGSLPCVVTAHNGPRMMLPAYYQQSDTRWAPLPTVVGISAANAVECRAAGLSVPGYIYSDVPIGPILNGASLTKGGFRGVKRYVAFLGRLDEDKGAATAIQWLKTFNNGNPPEERLTLLIAAKRPDTPEAQSYFENEVQPHLGEEVIFLGPIGGQDKIDFLSKALALVFPIQWQEPFGLVPVEAMAAGTPVICRPLGGVRETVEDGVSGFWVHTPKEAVRAIRRVLAGDISREACQAQAQRFASGMTPAYERLYEELLSGLTSQEAFARVRDAGLI